jgi:hypothetical protein
MINKENWTHCEYSADENRVSIAMGGAFGPDSEYLEIFYINKYKGDDLTYQDVCHSILEACELVNKKYGHWDFEDKAKQDDSSGCSSCQAH